MSRTPTLLVLLAAALLAGGARAPARGQDGPTGAGVIALDSRVLTFAPSRDDFTVGVAVLSVHCAHPARVRLDGAAPASAWTTIELTRVSPNRFALPSVRIEHPPDELVCLSIKVWFAEVGNQQDGLFYERLDDRYALVAYATHTREPDWAAARPRFGQNRVATLRAFVDALDRPFPIALNDRPLSGAPR